jgi:hypothetical protein
VTPQDFENHLTQITTRLSGLAASSGFRDSREFEQAVRAQAQTQFPGVTVTGAGNGQSFPDIGIGAFGIEVKFTEGTSWRCVANSVLESDRRGEVEHVYVVYAKMGDTPEVRWRVYQDAVMHVRTSHVPRFEIDMEAKQSLFERVNVPYERFRVMDMQDKMVVIRKYAKEHVRGSGRRLWWIEDEPDEPHSLPAEVRLYTTLSTPKKLELRAEAAIVSPRIVGSSRERGKYDDAAMYLLTYHGVLCTQVRDLFSAGSVAMRSDKRRGGLYIDRALQDIEPQMLAALKRIPDSIIREYWDSPVPPTSTRLTEWLRQADRYAQGWVPSQTLFLGQAH